MGLKTQRVRSPRQGSQKVGLKTQRGVIYENVELKTQRTKVLARNVGLKAQRVKSPRQESGAEDTES